MFKGRLPSTHLVTNTMWSKWVVPAIQWTRMGNSNFPGVLEKMLARRQSFRASPEEVVWAEETPLYNTLPGNKNKMLFLLMGLVVLCETTRGRNMLCGVSKNKLQKLLKEKANDTVYRRESYPGGPRDCQMREVASALSLYWFMVSGKCPVGQLHQWIWTNWWQRGKPIWAVAFWQDITAEVDMSCRCLCA